MTELYQIKTTYFCAGLIVSNNRVVDAAPILKWAIGKPLYQVIHFFTRKGVFKSCDKLNTETPDYFKENE